MHDQDDQTMTSRFPRIVAMIGAVGFLLTGVGAMAAPESFFDAAATFEPYNQHFIQDIGAFNLGIGAILLLATRPAADALASALIGAAVGSAAHVLSHVIGHDLGGQPGVDLPMFTLLTILLGVAGWMRWGEVGARAGDAGPNSHDGEAAQN